MTYVEKLNDIELTELDLSAPITEASAEQLPAPVDNVVVLPKGKRQAAEVYAFDYSGVSAAVAKEAEAIAMRIRDRHRGYTIETGKELLVIKKKLGHGKFGKWLEFHFGWKERTAQNYMNSATAFGSTPQVIDVLPPSTVYKLAAKSTPDALRQSVIDEIKRGEKPDPKQIEKKIAAIKNEAPQKASADERIAAGSPQKPSDVSVPDDVVASLDRALATEAPAKAIQDGDGAQSPPIAQEQEFRAQKIVGHLKKRFGDKFSLLRDAILKTDLDALRKALSEA
ncbi:DUF3102 domain-containing protein [Rhizobium leguminosarum]|uniref:DUF3102 domain-containing protein n=1 Tax=Rhizobium leguminosarum TaxID=384 RepID=UPI001C91FF35|nr:DUF3102 domain-containing protein [Rhizobium leguminosarum]MBY3025446.1 DUF3102 domain-containing protein [Rhizobium leguminosarum]